MFSFFCTKLSKDFFKHWWNLNRNDLDILQQECLCWITSAAVQRKSISGLRLWGSWCTERAAATSGSRSAHWDCSYSRKPTSRQNRQIRRDKNKIRQVNIASFCQDLYKQHVGYLAGGQSSWRSLWDHSQKKVLGVAQNLERLHQTKQFIN